jgi:outer membrane protein OmpA-like peptidoglycan-associated protein
MQYRAFYTVCLTLFFTLFLSQGHFAQVDSKLKKAYEIFDYEAFTKRYAKEKVHSLDEMELWATVAYKTGKFQEAKNTLFEIASKRPLTDYEKNLQMDIDRVMSPKNEEAIYLVKPTTNNTINSEFTALIDNDSIYYASNRLAKVSVKNRDVRKKQPFINLYKAVKFKDSVYNDARIKPTYTDLNEGPMCVFEKGYLITRNFPSKKGMNNLRLVYADSNFKDVKEFEFNNAAFSVGHATTNETFDWIIFSSDMPAGDGKTDLFISYFDKATSKFLTPKRLGKNINTVGNEMFPAVIDNKLFFASNGHPGVGQLDIFEIALFDSVAKPGLLSYPINTVGDDFGLLSADGGKTGYFTSNRDSKMDDDIYYFDRSKITFGCEKECNNAACVNLEIDDFKNFALDQFIFSWNMGNGDSISGPFVNYCYREVGKYEITLNVYDVNAKTWNKQVATDSVFISSTSKNNPEFIINKDYARLESITPSIKDAFDLGTVSNNYWVWGDGQTSTVSNVSHAYESAGVYQVDRHVKVTTSGGCCYRKISNYTQINANTKEEQELLAKGLGGQDPSDRYIAKIRFVDEQGKPVSGVNYAITSPNSKKNIDGISADTTKVDLDRSWNYQLTATSSQGTILPATLSTALKTEEEYSYYEFVVRKVAGPMYVIKTVDTKGNLVTGANMALMGDSTSTVNLANGIWMFDKKPSGVYAFDKKYYFDLQVASANWGTKDTNIVVLQKVEAGAVFRLDNIYFDLGKYNIRPDAALELNKVLELMIEYPTLEIELRAHTDARGSAESNFTLSDNRAKSAAAYIVSKGIAASRIVGQGYGETLLLNKCKDGVKCNEKEHQFNRRVEIAIKKI